MRADRQCALRRFGGSDTHRTYTWVGQRQPVPPWCPGAGGHGVAQCVDVLPASVLSDLEGFSPWESNLPFSMVVILFISQRFGNRFVPGGMTGYPAKKRSARLIGYQPGLSTVKHNPVPNLALIRLAENVIPVLFVVEVEEVLQGEAGILA